MASVEDMTDRYALSTTWIKSQKLSYESGKHNLICEEKPFRRQVAPQEGGGSTFVKELLWAELFHTLPHNKV